MKIDWFKLIIAFVLLAGLAIYFFNSSSELKLQERGMEIKEQAQPNRFDKYNK